MMPADLTQDLALVEQSINMRAMHVGHTGGAGHDNKKKW